MSGSAGSQQWDTHAHYSLLLHMPCLPLCGNTLPPRAPHALFLSAVGARRAPLPTRCRQLPAYGGEAALRGAFFNSLKEAAHICRGSAQRVMEMAAGAQVGHPGPRAGRRDAGSRTVEAPAPGCCCCVWPMIQCHQGHVPIAPPLHAASPPPDPPTPPPPAGGPVAPGAGRQPAAVPAHHGAAAAGAGGGARPRPGRCACAAVHKEGCGR